MKTRQYIVAVAMLTLAACSDKKQDVTTDTSTPNKVDVAAVIVDKAPENSQDIHKVRDTAKVGDTITIHGKVMGREDPFVPGRAIMILGDPKKITSCDLMEDDHCSTPWDVCCDDPDTIKQSVVTVQLVGDDGLPLKADFKGAAGIKELSELVVTGVVAEGSNKDNMLLNASAIFVK